MELLERVGSGEKDPVSLMNEDDVSSEALLVTSVPLEELGVVVSSSSASGELA